MRTFRQVLCAGLSLLAFVSLVVLVFCYFEVFATLYALAIFIGTLVALVLLLMLPIAA